MTGAVGARARGCLDHAHACAARDGWAPSGRAGVLAAASGTGQAPPPPRAPTAPGLASVVLGGGGRGQGGWAPLSDADVESLRAGDRVRLTGVLYTRATAAHGAPVPAHREGWRPCRSTSGGRSSTTPGRRRRGPARSSGRSGPRPAGGWTSSRRAAPAGAQGHDGEGRALAGGEGRPAAAPGRLTSARSAAPAPCSPVRQARRDRGLRGPRHRGDPPFWRSRASRPSRQRLPRWRSLSGRDEGLRNGRRHEAVGRSARRGPPSRRRT